MVFVSGPIYGWTSTPFLIALGFYFLFYYIDVIGANYVNHAISNALENNYQYLKDKNDGLDEQFNKVYQLLQGTCTFNKDMATVSLIPSIAFITAPIMTINLRKKGIKLGGIIDGRIQKIATPWMQEENKDFEQLCKNVKNDPLIKNTLILLVAQNDPCKNKSIDAVIIACILGKLPLNMQAIIQGQLKANEFLQNHSQYT